MSLVSLTLEDFEQSIQSLLDFRRSNLPDARQLTPLDIAINFRAYEAAIKPNFVKAWMEPTSIRCRSSVAWRTCADNLACEKDPEHDHRLMLERFTNQVRHYEMDGRLATAIARCQPFIKGLTEIAREPCAVDGLATMAYLENDSLVFINYMDQGCDILEITDKEYLKVHGVADIEHARAFIEAVRAEVKYTGILPTNRPYELVKGLVHEIFHAHASF